MSGTAATPAPTSTDPLQQRLAQIDADLDEAYTRCHDNYRRMERYRHNYNVERNGIILGGGDPFRIVPVFTPESFKMWSRVYLLKRLRSRTAELKKEQRSLHVWCIEAKQEREDILNEIKRRTVDNGIYGYTDGVGPEEAGPGGA
ncbi:uncharacterized protein LAJ45_03647 [Morchella importuna]|uniref:uncharacterized protein n=1 Tax=Morchella importuna TaxID=1174673 RepID=UPI001E8E6A9B|nr:uncharacterized protein LAJ45_03647 [Morchella importuna]KAH8152221.1 hypothetical protein LAJ45_03647 [Morchella importuna]